MKQLQNKKQAQNKASNCFQLKHYDAPERHFHLLLKCSNQKKRQLLGRQTCSRCVVSSLNSYTQLPSATQTDIHTDHDLH